MTTDATSGESGQSPERAADPIHDAILDRLLAPVSPGMGGADEPIWETYRPEGVAILLAEAVRKVAVPEAEADALFGQVEALEGFLRRMADALQEDGYETDTVLVEVLAGILGEAGFHA